MNSSNTPSTSSDNFAHDDPFQRGNESAVGGFTYGLGVSLGILVLITTITVTSYFCTRDTDPSSTGQSEGQQVDNQHVINVDGIDEATLKSYPKCLYSQLEKNKLKGLVSQNSCSVCLGDYKGSDIIRELPECGHVFHVKCVDPWLRLHPTCPLCRTSPLLTPLSTPLVEVVPLASNLRGG